MEAPKYYEIGKDDTYCVHFPNKQGLSIERIKEIFSEWGNVHAVTKAGDEYGYRFVRYRHEDEVNRCIEALRNHSTIRLLKPRPSSGQKNKQGSNNNNQDNPSPWGPKSFAASPRRDNDIPAVGENSAKNSATNFGRNKDVSNAGGVVTSIPECSWEPQRQKSVFNRKPEEVLPGLKTEDVSTKLVGSFIPAGPLEDLANIPELVPATVNGYSQGCGGAFFKDPVTKTQCEKGRVEVAEQVVVANVPTEFSENLVLHLLRKHEPISISPMKLAAYPAIRYCVVFFSSVQQAKAVENEFNNRAFTGQNLIVLRP